MIHRIKNLFNYFIFLILLFFSLELITIFFNSLQNKQYFYKTSNERSVILGKNLNFSFYKNYKIRTNEINSLENIKKDNRVLIFGDSVTIGYGVEYTNSFTDIINNLFSKKKNVFAIGELGNDLSKFSNFIEEFDIREDDIIIYQFNYNDILDNSVDGNLNVNLADNKIDKILLKTNQFRYNYLNRSEFLKFLQSKASILRKKTNGSCEKRGIDALGPYTYSYKAKGFENESNVIWEKFEKTIESVANKVNEQNLKFFFSITPISLQLPHHEKINIYNYDTSCGTINPLNEIKIILENNKINIIDPTEKFIEISNKLYLEENKAFLFFDGDTNHPNIIGHRILGTEIFKQLNY
jgi:hypothetical protein